MALPAGAAAGWGADRCQCMSSSSSRGERSPLATTLAYLEVARAGSEDSQWFELLVRRAFERLLNNVAATRAAAAAASHRDVVGDVVAVVSESLLQKLLSLYPHMHWDPRCMLALLGMLEAEEGDKPMAVLRPKASKGPSNVWKVLQGWVYAAALVAPTRTGRTNARFW
ncbi:hypothetical protein DUNSADRAFT_9320 [Dunaliella salina]|uniref:Uncharacterized protein n=1 Tax=Dunaliella salina TaxID=3046 RepID=A0ABQ7GHP7_DUNSA|nr:hypothetical protein DUNSADRAFT_9320 [Dunaliella salina]|eukprot:KAF5834124.1 hypothetical protein DUNSADRAFT_9320 [Dunaliella salina]